MKKLKTIIFTFAYCCITTTINAQADSTFSFLQIIKGSFSNFYVDNLSNIYLITTTNQLKKIANNGDSVALFNDVKRFGNLYSIDVTNPLKILLFYKDFSTVVVVDRFLNMRNTINFKEQNIFSAQCIASSYDNNIWLFDEQDFKLKKINEQGNLLQDGTDFRMLFDTVPLPTEINDRENFIYLYDPEKGFYIFDYYGGFKNRLPFLGWTNVGVSEKIIYGFNNNQMYCYALNSLVLKQYTLPPFFANYTTLKTINGKIYLLKPDGVYIYQIKQ